MSTFNFSDITLAGAYVNAMKAAQESDHRSAERHLETGESRNILKSLWTRSSASPPPPKSARSPPN